MLIHASSWTQTFLHFHHKDRVLTFCHKTVKVCVKFWKFNILKFTFKFYSFERISCIKAVLILHWCDFAILGYLSLKLRCIRSMHDNLLKLYLDKEKAATDNMTTWYCKILTRLKKSWKIYMQWNRTGLLALTIRVKVTACLSKCTLIPLVFQIISLVRLWCTARTYKRTRLVVRSSPCRADLGLANLYQAL